MVHALCYALIVGQRERRACGEGGTWYLGPQLQDRIEKFAATSIHMDAYMQLNAYALQ